MTQFKFQIPLAQIAKICSVRGPNSKQSAMSPLCDQDISNGSRFAVLTTHSYSPYYSIRNFFIGFRIADACNVFLATIGNAAQIQLSLEMHWSLLQFDTLLKTILTTCSGAFTIISQGPDRFFYHPRTAMPSTSRKQSINGCSLPHTHGEGKADMGGAPGSARPG